MHSFTHARTHTHTQLRTMHVNQPFNKENKIPPLSQQMLFLVPPNNVRSPMLMEGRERCHVSLVSSHGLADSTLLLLSAVRRFPGVFRPKNRLYETDCPLIPGARNILPQKPWLSPCLRGCHVLPDI